MTAANDIPPTRSVLALQDQSRASPPMGGSLSLLAPPSQLIYKYVQDLHIRSWGVVTSPDAAKDISRY